MHAGCADGFQSIDRGLRKFRGWFYPRHPRHPRLKGLGSFALVAAVLRWAGLSVVKNGFSLWPFSLACSPLASCGPRARGMKFPG